MSAVKFFLGIDPGKTGGIAWLHRNGQLGEVLRMPDTEAEVLNALRSFKGGTTFCVLERVSAWPRMGVVSAFTFGRGYGALLMALAGCAVPFENVTPATWQRVMGCLSKRDKNVTKRRAQQLFPGIRVTHATADALLIAEYGRRITLGLAWRK